MADWTITSNEALPSNAKTKYSFVTTTLSANLREPVDRSQNNKNAKYPCLACSADGCTDEKVTHHPTKIVITGTPSLFMTGKS